MTAKLSVDFRSKSCDVTAPLIIAFRFLRGPGYMLFNWKRRWGYLHFGGNYPAAITAAIAWKPPENLNLSAIHLVWIETAPVAAEQDPVLVVATVAVCHVQRFFHKFSAGLIWFVRVVNVLAISCHGLKHHCVAYMKWRQRNSIRITSSSRQFRCFVLRYFIIKLTNLQWFAVVWIPIYVIAWSKCAPREPATHFGHVMT